MFAKPSNKPNNPAISNLLWLTVPFYLLLTTACTCPKTNTGMEIKALPKLTVYTDVLKNNIELSYNSADSILTSAAKASNLLPVMIGVLGINFNLSPVSSVLKMNGWDVPLTPIRMMEARSPYPIQIQPDEVGKLALVQGHFDGSTIYQATILAVFPDEPIALLYQLLHQHQTDVSPLLQKR
ncbi:MAG TPA: hypothetical protein PK239_09685 [Chitinophagales bacterium]|nr:hypothetical protein [Chitinophagales bacterium]HRK27547.1 hypothetical protein [Chitinophagales bacterium]